MENTNLSTALAYGHSGWRVLPICWPDENHECACGKSHKGRDIGKAPLTTHGLKDASSDETQIKQWWQTYPNANIGIRCGLISNGLVVVDIDGEEGKQSIKGKKLLPTKIAATGGGGFHYFYYFGGRLRPKTGLLPKVDLRAEDSYVVAPPSLHRSGQRYEWVTDENQTPLPEWVVDLATPHIDDVEEVIDDDSVERKQSKIGRAAMEFVTQGAPIGEQRSRAVAAARNLLEAGYPVKTVADRIWQGLKISPQDPNDRAWTPQDALKIAQSLSKSPAPPLKALEKPTIEPRSNSLRTKIHVISARDLLKKDFPPVQYVIDGLLPEGLTILAAKPKIGKTWWSLGCGLAVPYGGFAYGSRQAVKGDVLYMALEDGERRIQARLKMILSWLGEDEGPAGLHFAYAWPKVGEGGVEALEKWMDEYPNTKLIVVDTLRRIRPQEKGSRTLYNQDYDAIAPLADFSHSRTVSILVVMHTRKLAADDALDMVGGTLGITGAADHVLILNRTRNQGEATLQMMGRDIEDTELAFRWKVPQWELIGDAREHQMSKERREIIDCFQSAKNVPATPKEIAEKLGKDVKNIKSLMWKMSQDNLLVAMGGYYSVAEGVVSNNSGYRGYPVTVSQAEPIETPKPLPLKRIDKEELPKNWGAV